MLIKRPESKQPITGVERGERELKTKGAVGADRWGWASTWIWPGSHTHPSPPVREWLISKWEPGTGKPSASGQKSHLGYSEVLCTGWEDNGRVLTGHSTLLQRLPQPLSHRSDQSHHGLSQLVTQPGRSTAQKLKTSRRHGAGRHRTGGRWELVWARKKKRVMFKWSEMELKLQHTQKHTHYRLCIKIDDMTAPQKWSQTIWIASWWLAAV